MYSRVLLLTLLLSTTSGCASLSLFGDKEEPKPIPVEIRTVEVKTPIVHPDMPRAISLRTPQWYVVSDKNVDTFMEDIKKRHAGQLVFVAMSVGDYELMAYNMQEIKRYINQLKEVVIYYQSIDKEEEDESENTNTGESEKSRSGSHQQTQDERGSVSN